MQQISMFLGSTSELEAESLEIYPKDIEEHRWIVTYCTRHRLLCQEGVKNLRVLGSKNSSRFKAFKEHLARDGFLHTLSLL